MQALTLFKALADDTRLRCLLLISQEDEICVCELTHALELSQPKISRHLALLRESEIILDQRKGQWVYYRIHPQLESWAKELIAQTLSANQTLIHHNQQRLAQMVERPSC